jgi:hypothetical protein
MSLEVAQTLLEVFFYMFGILLVNLGIVYWVIRFILWLTDLQ